MGLCQHVHDIHHKDGLVTTVSEPVFEMGLSRSRAQEHVTRCPPATKRPYSMLRGALTLHLYKRIFLALTSHTTAANRSTVTQKPSAVTSVATFETPGHHGNALRDVVSVMQTSTYQYFMKIVARVLVPSLVQLLCGLP
jgi:hypothetical protein